MVIGGAGNIVIPTGIHTNLSHVQFKLESKLIVEEHFIYRFS